MSTTNYYKAKQVIQTNEEMADFIGGCSNELINLAEENLDIKFRGIYLDFLQTFGAGNFGAQEIYGIINDKFENSSIPDAIWYTLMERREINLPHNLFVIYDTGSEELYCLDFNKIGENGEPKVVSFVPCIKLEGQKYEIIASDFGDFLLEIVMEEV